MNSEAEDGPVISLDELLESCGIALLRCPNQLCVIHATGAVFFGWRYGRQYGDVIYVVG
jgi:hypothetical protein